MNSHQSKLTTAYSVAVRGVRESYGPHAVGPTVDHFAWERAQKICTPERTADSRWEAEAPAFLRYLLLDEILLLDKSKRKQKRKQK